MELFSIIYELKCDFIHNFFEYVIDKNLIQTADLACSDKVLKYFSDDEMENKYRVVFNSDEKAVCANNESSNELLNGKYLFVLRENAKLYLLPSHDDTIHHSSHNFEDIVAVGEVKIKDGIVKFVSNESGHYKPGLSTIKKFAEAIAIMIPNVKKRKQHANAEIQMFTIKDKEKKNYVEQYYKDMLQTDKKINIFGVISENSNKNAKITNVDKYKVKMVICNILFS